MEIKLLPKSVRETLRSEVNFRSIGKCIAQLVYNSLDAKSASIAVRINLVTFKIQVIDNGTGISKHNLKLIGYRHATSKYNTIEDLEKNPNMFPSRGECLASIIKLSETVKIQSRYLDNKKTYCKTFENGKSLPLISIKLRPSKGTTIIIENFMYNLPVRKKSVNQNFCLDELKIEIEHIALMHPNTSFSLRNDVNGEIIFQTLRTKFVFQTAAILYGKEFSRRLRKICYKDGKFSITGLLSLESHTNNRIQFVYINNRFVSKTKIHDLLNKIISQSKIIKNVSKSPVAKQKYAAYIINIKCSYLELDIVDFIEPEIEFKNWEHILSCIENALIDFLKNYDLLITKETNKNRYQNGSPLTESTPKVRTSLVNGVIRGIPMKRKVSEQIEQSLSISSLDSEARKIINISHMQQMPEKQTSDSEKEILNLDIAPPLKKIRTTPKKTKENVSLVKNKRGRKKKPNENKKQTNQIDIKQNISLKKYKKLDVKKDKNKYNFFTSNFDSPPKKQMKENENDTNEKATLKSKKEKNNVTNKCFEIKEIHYNHDSNFNLENIDIMNEQLNVSLESKSEGGKKLILDKFLKSTAIYRTDDDLKDDYISFESAESYTNRSKNCIVSSLQHCKTKSTSTKISITKTVEHIKINNTNMEQASSVFKIPEIPVWRKRKSSSNDTVSNILAQFKTKNIKSVPPKNFEIDFIKNISSKSIRPTISNHILKMLDNLKNGPSNKKYECTIKITKQSNYIQSSDFLKPAIKLDKKFSKPYQKFRHIDLNKHKKIIHSNTMLKTFYDLKNSNHNYKPKNYKNYHMDKYKCCNLIPNINRNYLTYKNNNESLSTSLKKEISNISEFSKEPNIKCLPIFNVQRSKHQKYNLENKNCNPFVKNTLPKFENRFSNLSYESCKIDQQKPLEIYDSNRLKTIKHKNNTIFNPVFENLNKPANDFEKQLNNNNSYFSNPVISFKPFSRNPHLEKLFSKNQITYSKPDFKFSKSNFKETFDGKYNYKSEYSFIPTYDSHQISRESLMKQNINTKNNFTKNNDRLINKAVYDTLTHNQNLLHLLSTKKNIKKTESSSLTFLSEEKEIPETPEALENIEDKSIEIENNCEKSKPNLNKTTRNINIDKFYDRENITKWVNNTIQNTPIAENLEIINSQNLSLTSNTLKSSVYFNKKINTTQNMIQNINYNKHLQHIPINNVLSTNEYTKENEINKKSNELIQTNENKNNSVQISKKINIEPNHLSEIFSENSSPYKNDDFHNNTYTENGNKENILLNLSQKSSASKESKNVFNFIPLLEKPKNIFNNLQFDFTNVDNRSSSKKTIILSSSEQKDDNISEAFSPSIQKTKNVFNCQNKNFETTPMKEKGNSPILFSFLSNPISAFENNTNTKQITVENENKSITKQDVLNISVSNFSSASNLIQEKDVTNVINIIDESTDNDMQPQNCENIPIIENESETNKFPEDCSNVVIENYRNIDEKLNKSKECNNYEILNNSLSKNNEESKEINQIVTETVNGMSEWIKNTSVDNKAFYINSRTGMTSYLTPKEMEGCIITKRPAYVPKGMSPILRKSTVVTKELSQNSKNVLHKTIANTENDELQTVKWINYFQNKDSEHFFNDLYSNCKHYELEIPNINQYAIPKKIVKGFENYSFSKEDFNKITVINQCDNKFIVTKMEIQGKYDLLVMFDQHAVHERIRLEKLLKDYEEKENKLKSVKCLKPVKFTLDNFEIKMLNIYKQNFECWGFMYEVKDNNVIFSHIPSCWQKKDDSNVKCKDYSTIESLIRALIQEESNWLKNVRRINIALPLVIQNTIKTEACRSAIKFGDPLTKEQCENLMKELFLCDLPFNCAHGRPTLYPVIDLNTLKNLNNKEEDTINLSSLRK